MYYRVTTKLEQQKAGAGLGYSELYGHDPRYYRKENDAIARAKDLNETPTLAGVDDDDLAGTYFVEERQDGQDADDTYYRDDMRIDGRHSILFPTHIEILPLADEFGQFLVNNVPDIIEWFGDSACKAGYAWEADIPPRNEWQKHAREFRESMEELKETCE